MALGQPQLAESIMKIGRYVPVAVHLRQEIEVVHPVLRIEIYPVGQLTMQYQACPAQADIGRIACRFAQYGRSGVVLLVPQPELVQESKLEILAPVLVQVEFERILFLPV